MAYEDISPEELEALKRWWDLRSDTCYHEAAHVVFDYHAGRTIRYVQVPEDLKQSRCMSAIPVNPFPWEGIELAASGIAGEYAVYRRRGQKIVHKPFDEFCESVRIAEEKAEAANEEANDDEVMALRVLERMANSPRTKALLLQMRQQPVQVPPELLPPRYDAASLSPNMQPPVDFPPWDDVKKSYELACEQAAFCVDLWWDEISTVAEALFDEGYLDGDECVELIEAASSN
jgi:hypothetical protein